MANEKCRGAILLAEWLEKHQMSMRALGRELGWQPGEVSRMVSGERRPGVKKTVLLQKRCRIPMSAWTD